MSLFKLKPLPYSETALEPYLSAETLQYHHGKHQKAYVEKLNVLLASSAFANQTLTLEALIERSEGGLFNQAAQVWNHEFYWTCLCPAGQGGSPDLVSELLEKAFQTIDSFKADLRASVLGLFGSGWVWLVFDPTNRDLKLVSLNNADNPLRLRGIPVLAIDVWEHAYYIDYRNQRDVYFEAVWQLIDWERLSCRLRSAAGDAPTAAV